MIISLTYSVSVLFSSKHFYSNNNHLCLVKNFVHGSINNIYADCLRTWRIFFLQTGLFLLLFYEHLLESDLRIVKTKSLSQILTCYELDNVKLPFKRGKCISMHSLENLFSFLNFWKRAELTSGVTHDHNSNALLSPPLSKPDNSHPNFVVNCKFYKILEQQRKVISISP